MLLNLILYFGLASGFTGAEPSPVSTALPLMVPYAV